MARELEAKTIDSVFDFLYVDHHRVGLFLSQFSEFGNLTDIVHTKGATDDASVSAGVKLVIGGESKSGSSESVQSKYNPLWSQALNFLDEVNARGMVNRSLSRAAIGSLVLTAGTLNLLNMKALERMWAVAAGNAKDEIQRSTPDLRNRKDRRTGGQSSGKSTPDGGGPGLLRLIGSFDQPVMMALNAGDARLWSTLDPNYLVGGSSDLALKHGVQISGNWHVLGILDCMPGELVANEADVGRICGGVGNAFSGSALTVIQRDGCHFRPPRRLPWHHTNRHYARDKARVSFARIWARS